MERKITHKVGVKLLTDLQLENVFPTYENLLQKISACRDVARAELSSDREKRHYQYNLMYDNVFSILGKRGAGKTSVAFTLRKKIMDRYRAQCDVVLPLIIPEVIPEDCPVLGWLLAIVKDEIEHLEEEILELEQENHHQDDFWSKCKYADGEKRERALKGQLEQLIQLFYAKGYNSKNEESYYQAIDNSVQQAEDYYRFAKEIARLWDSWVARIQELHVLKSQKGANASALKKEDFPCPMIYFIFDDVDLAPEKIEELLSVIIKYLSHPNIIVITTADEELFLEVIENHLKEKIGKTAGGISYHYQYQYSAQEDFEEGESQKEKDDLVRQTTRMYLGKVLPASTRHYLHVFNTAKEKECFCVEEDQTMGEGVKEQIQELINYKSKGKINNFMETDGRVINFYLNFIGNTARQISNVYIALWDLVHNLGAIIDKQREGKTSREKSIQQIYQSCRYFMCIALKANHKLSNMIEKSDDFVEDFVDGIFLYEYNHWKLYCNYASLSENLYENLKGCHKKVCVEIGLALFSLLAFVENVLLIMERVFPGGITERAKVHVVMPLTEYIANTAFEQRSVFRNDLNADTFFEQYVDLLNRLEHIVENRMTNTKFNLEYFYNFKTYHKKCDPEDLRVMYMENRKWFSELAGMLSMVYGNVYVVSQKDVAECLIYSNRTFLNQYQKRIDLEIKNNIRRCYMYVEMHKEWELAYENYEKAENRDGAGSKFYEFIMNINDELISEDNSDVHLREIIDMVLQKVQVDTPEGIQDFMAACPPEIEREIVRNWKKLLNDRNITRSLIIKYTKRVRDASIGTRVELRDFPNMVTVLENCARVYISFASSINEMIKRISGLVKEQEKKAVVELDAATYTRLLTILKGVHNNILKRAPKIDYWDLESEQLRESVEEVFGDMDVLIQMNAHPSEELRQAVILSMQVVAIKILQVIYLFQTAQERYNSGDSMSSRELEQVEIDGELVDTYYYQLFELMTDMIDKPIDDDNVDEAVMSAYDIGEDIRIICRSVRELYLDSLIERIENE